MGWLSSVGEQWRIEVHWVIQVPSPSRLFRVHGADGWLDWAASFPSSTALANQKWSPPFGEQQLMPLVHLTRRMDSLVCTF
jgi:hypothetical protein